MKLLKSIRDYFYNTKHIDKRIDQLVLQNDLLINFLKDGLNKPIERIENLGSQELISNIEFKNQEVSIQFDAIKVEDFKTNLPTIYLNKTNQDLISGTLSNVLGGGANTAITSLATRGLFKATADPVTLMKLASGGFGSSVMKGGRITQQAGFIQAGTTMFTPMIVFQIASMVTGQYYMNNISKQLNSVQEKLDELLNLFHIERQAKLVKAFTFISKNLNKKNFVLEDFVLIKIIFSELTDIREEYFLMIDDLVDKIKENNKYETVFSSLAEAKKIAEEFEKTGFIFKMKTSLVADELFHLANITEFHMNLCYKEPDVNRIHLISEKLDEFSKFKKQDFAFYKSQDLYNDIKNNTLKQIKEAKSTSIFSEDKIQHILSNLEGQFNDFDVFKEDKLNSTMKLYYNIISPLRTPKTILIDNRDNDVKMYIE